MKVVRFIFIVFCTLSLSTEVKSQCTLSLSAKRSGCYISGGQSKFTISVEVGWTNAPSGQNIIITGPPGSVPATRTITPGTITVTYASNNSGGTVTSTQQIVSPQVVAFELDANSAIGLTVSGVFSGTPSCNATSNTVNAPSSCQPMTCNTGNLGGTVFFDFNADGIKQTDEIETGISGVIVTAIDVNGMSYATTSVKYGRWVISGIANSAYPVRVEFSNLPGYARQGTPRGSDGNTTVQFIPSSDCNVDLGVLNNTDFCDSKPPLFTPCYVSGNPEESDAGSRNRDVFVMFDYDASGAKDPSKIKTLAYSQHVGSLWGVAFNKYTDKIFTSATIKRHAGMGPEGIGGLYVLDKNAVTPGVVTSWNVSSDFGINVGTFPSNTTRGLPKGVTSTNEDIAGFTEVGKVGIGDIDISENGNQLYMVNLFDRKLYRIDLTAYNSNPSTTPTTDTNWSIPDPGCANGQFRPFAVKWYKGQVFVGAVCDASNGTKSNLRAYVFRLNPTTGVWTTIFDFPLTYPKGFPNSGDRSVTGWYPWTDDWNDFEIVKSPDEIAYPQPILSDIELDVEGSLIIGFADRGAIQTGYRAKSTNPSNSQLYSGFAGGDIIKAYDNGSGTYILENAAKAGPVIGYGPTNSQGPGFGEYYNDDWFSASTNLNHAECVMGGLALRSGSGQVITTHVDPVDFINWSGGVRHYNNTTGLTDQAFVLYRTTDGDAGTQGKAAGLGDLEVGCALPTFIEIGNRVWVDADQDGTQDPDEGPLAGVRVQLYKQDGTLLATTLTNATGEYYFSSSTPQMADPNLTWVGTGMDAMIQPSSAYYLVFGASQFSGGQLVLGGNNYNLTTANNESTSPANNSNDSDATLVSGLPRITINSSPIEGAVNHTYDVGFWLAPVCTIPTATVTRTNPACTGTNAPNNGVLTIEGFSLGQRYQYSTGATFNSGSALPASITAIPVGGVIVSNLANTSQQYTVRIYDATDNACFVDRTVSIAAASCGDCACKDFIYVNEVPLGSVGGGEVHKFEVNPSNGSLSEILNAGNAWYPGTGTSQLPNPHGLGVDLNGYLYIGNTATDPNQIRRLTCDGDIKPTSEFVISGAGLFLTNIGSYNEFIYSNGAGSRIYKWDPCTGNMVGFVQLGDAPSSEDWGMHISKTGVIYATHSASGRIWVIEATDSDFVNNTTFPWVRNFNAEPAMWTVYSGEGLGGITTDDAGNVYVVNAYANSPTTLQSRMLKFSPYPALNFLGATPVDNVNDGVGWHWMLGLAYSSASGKIYSSSRSPQEPCIFAWNTDMTAVGPVVGVVPSTSGAHKGLAISTECCPTSSSLSYTENVCSPGNGQKIYLNDVLDCGDGVICEGMWEEVTNTSGGAIVFNDCDLSITVNGSGCATYVIRKTTARTGVQQCDQFEVTLTVCTQVPSGTISPQIGTCTASTPNNNASINLTNITFGTQAGISQGTTYTGPAYNGSGTINVSGGAINFTGLMHNTQYTIRIYNASNNCYADYTVTIPTIACCALTVVCTPQPQTNCSPINGSASVVASNAVGIVTYLWSSGETTSSISNKAAATYTVTVTDGGISGCSRTCEAVIANNASAPTCTITVNTQPSCANLTGGNITVVPSPAGAYTYTWSDNGAATATRTGLTGGTYTVTVTNTTSNCTGVCNVTLTTPTNCCNITAIVPQNIECIDNGTPALITDNRIRFSANVTNTNTSLTGYNVTINGGTTITPNMNVPYGVTTFTLGAGTAGGGATFTVTVTDSATPGCTQTFQVTDPGGCNNTTPCPTPKCGTATIQVNGN